jgi:hypothetical protein
MIAVSQNSSLEDRSEMTKKEGKRGGERKKSMKKTNRRSWRNKMAEK